MVVCNKEEKKGRVSISHLAWVGCGAGAGAGAWVRVRACDLGERADIWESQFVYRDLITFCFIKFEQDKTAEGGVFFYVEIEKRKIYNIN